MPENFDEIVKGLDLTVEIPMTEIPEAWRLRSHAYEIRVSHPEVSRLLLLIAQRVT